MKAIFLALALMLLPAGMALADNDVGCGVGTQIWEGKEGLGAKLMASFTNGLTFQSISITFGLINCNGKDTVTADNNELRLRHYASQNFDRIAEDIASGRGESLAVVAHLLEVPEADQAHFNAFAQRHFGELFPTDRVTVGEMLGALDRLMATDMVLAAYSRS